MKKILLSLLLAGGVQNSFAIKGDPASSRVTESPFAKSGYLVTYWTGLLLAAKSGDTETVQLLITSGDDVNASDRYGQTVLMHAARWNRTEIVQLLRDAGAR